MLSAALLAVSLSTHSSPAELPKFTPAAPTPFAQSELGGEWLLAQAIVPATDDVGTIVTPTDNQFDITGGQISDDGANLFHSFEQFGLSAEQTANFMANPQVQTVLGRVVGGNASYIDGILRISNSDANLYLINPAGILFGQNARLDLNGSFTAATADRIGFDNGWLDVFKAGDYSQLVGEPTQFSFSALEPGSLVNLGDLVVGENQDLTLLGGNVVNGGRVSAPGGRVTLAAVNGQNMVTLGTADGLLTMELTSLETDQGISVSSLPELLTGGDFIEGSELVVAEDGTVLLQEVIIPEGTGTTAVAGNLAVAGSAAGEINLLGDQVALLGANVDASGSVDGGTVRIGGGYQGNDNILNADLTYTDADSTIDVSGGATGDGGLAIVWADDLTQFYGDVDASGGSQAGDGGFIEVSGKQQLVFRGRVDTTAVAGQMGTLLLDPTDIFIVAGTGDGDGDASTSTFQGDTNALLGQILENDFEGAVLGLSESELEGLAGDTNIILQATNDIFITDLADDQLTFAAGTGTIELLANSDNDFVDGGEIFVQDAADTIVTNGRDLLLSGNNLRLGSISTDGGDITLQGDVTLSNDTTLSTGETQAGDITIGGTFFFGEIDAEGAPVDLTVVSGEGDIDLNSRIGNSSALANVSLTGATVETESITALNGITIEAQEIPSNGIGRLDTTGGNGDIQLETQGNLFSFDNEITSGNDIVVIAGEDISIDRGSWTANNDISFITSQTVFLNDYSDADFSENQLVVDAGGALTIEGAERIRLEMDNDVDSVLRSGDALILRSDGVIINNANLDAGNGVSLLTLDGSPNSFTSTSTNTLISSDGNVTFGDYTGLALRIEAQGSIEGGSITIVGPNTTLINSGADDEIDVLNSLPALILRAGIEPQGAANVPLETVGGTTFNTSLADSPANITVGNIDTSVIVGEGGPVTLSATGSITTGTIDTSTFEEGDDFSVPYIRGGDVDITAVNMVETESITTRGGEININGAQITTDRLNAYNRYTALSDEAGEGLVTLVSTVGDIEVGSIAAGSGGVDIDAAGRFRAVGDTYTFNLGTSFDEFVTDVQIKDSPEVIDYLVSQGFERSELEASEATVSIINNQLIPASIIAYTGGNLDSNISIRHGGEDLPDSVFIQIEGEGQDYGFGIGPELTSPAFTVGAGEDLTSFDPLDPSAEIRLEQIGTFEVYDDIPDPISGTVGAIIVGNDLNNARVYPPLLNRPLPPVVEPPGVEPPGVEPPVVVNPRVEPPTPGGSGDPDDEGGGDTLIAADDPDIETANDNSRCPVEGADLVAARSGEDRSIEELPESCFVQDVENNILQIDDSIIDSTLAPSIE